MALGLCSPPAGWLWVWIAKESSLAAGQSGPVRQIESGSRRYKRLPAKPGIEVKSLRESIDS
jgi:hypothetical protein